MHHLTTMEPSRKGHAWSILLYAFDPVDSGKCTNRLKLGTVYERIKTLVSDIILEIGLLAGCSSAYATCNQKIGAKAPSTIRCTISFNFGIGVGSTAGQIREKGFSSADADGGVVCSHRHCSNYCLKLPKIKGITVDMISESEHDRLYYVYLMRIQ